MESDKQCTYKFLPRPSFEETNVLRFGSVLNPTNCESKAITISTHEPARADRPSVASIQAHILHDLISDSEGGRDEGGIGLNRASFKGGGNALK